MSPKDVDPSLEPALRDVESIQNLDTARMALRWALERMRALERRVEEVERTAKASDAARARVTEELDGARELLTRRSAEALERERYYAKIEEYLTAKLEGGLDPVALARREARIDEREAELQRREIDTENRIKAAQRRSDEEMRRAQADAAAAADAKIKETRDDFERRTIARDRELSERLIAIHEKDAQLTALEKSLEERRKRFEEFHAAQRAALERESAAISQAAADQAEFLERRVEQALAAKTTALERSWQADKQALMEEISAWRAKAREHLPALFEAQRAAAELENERVRLAQENAVLQHAKATLTEELARWRAQAQNDVPALLAASRRAAEAEEAAQALRLQLAAARRAAEEARAETLAFEMGHELRVQELARVEAALWDKLRDSERSLFRQYDAWLEREGALRRRDQDWRAEAEARREAADVLRAEVAAQRDELKRAIAEYQSKARTLAGRTDKGEGL